MIKKLQKSLFVLFFSKSLNFQKLDSIYDESSLKLSVRKKCFLLDSFMSLLSIIIKEFCIIGS